jgi:hypothetical protein
MFVNIDNKKDCGQSDNVNLTTVYRKKMINNAKN